MLSATPRLVFSWSFPHALLREVSLSLFPQGVSVSSLEIFGFEELLLRVHVLADSFGEFQQGLGLVLVEWHRALGVLNS